MSELIPAGIEASLVAFRTAMLSLQCQIDHFKEADTQETIWSAIVNSEEEDTTKLIQRFDKEMVTILHPILGFRTNVLAGHEPSLDTICECCFND